MSGQLSASEEMDDAHAHDDSAPPSSSESEVVHSSSPEAEKQSSPTSHHRGGSTMRGGGPALSVLNLLRGRGQFGGMNDEEEEDSDEEMGGMSGMGMPLGMLRPRGATGQDMKKELKALHPYATILGPADIESCIRLEEAAFPEDHKARAEKIRYRLTTCGELSLGIFSSAVEGSDILKSPTGETANAIESSRAERKGVLLGAVVATKTQNNSISEQDTMLPESWQKSSEDETKSSNLDGTSDAERQGHNEAGRTIALHSFSVVPDYQHLGLGSILMKSYVQRMTEADIADRICTSAPQRLIPFYTKLGFENKGRTAAKQGGDSWVDLVLEFEGIKKGDASEDE